MVLLGKYDTEDGGGSAASLGVVADGPSTPSAADTVTNLPKSKVTNFDRYYEWNAHSFVENDSPKNIDKLITLPVESKNLLYDLKLWAAENHVSQSTCSKLLVILKKHELQVPISARTLMSTPRSISNLLDVTPGKYCHFGVEAGILNSLKKYFHNPPPSIKLNFNIDGLPLAQSSNSVFWPILGSLAENFYTDVFVIGIYHGYKKPDNVNDFLKCFVENLKDVLLNGIQWEEEIVKVHINCFVCDAPAKAFLTSVKTHSGYFACGKCTQEGDYYEHRVIYPEINSTLRTDDSFRERLQEEHHLQERSILEDIKELGMVSQVVIDYMHLVCLGVTKKILKKLVHGRMNQRLTNLNECSVKFESLKKDIPLEFARKPRELSTVDKWKATEYRQFLLYTGVLLLKDILPAPKYQHFLSLSCAIRILSSSSYLPIGRDYANKLLIYFVKEFKTFYGYEEMSYNVHGLLHLCEDVKNFGVLDNFSAFKFENFMYNLKKCVKSCNKPLEQCHNRITEIMSLPVVKKTAAIYPHISNDEENGRKILKLHFQNFIIIPRHPDNCVNLKNGQIVVINNVLAKDKIFVSGRVFKKRQEYFEIPCKSSEFGIYVVNDSDLSDTMFIDVSDVERKCVKLFLNDNESLVIPLLHTFNDDCNR
ncbi:hypothetical protein NQ314_002970 [Rhamnusium bicolor]|uniref:Transposase domain-containing protein n=1 Tax=Rhamnusium bicolor TaxID=1586634 RepID=A0AAV8ZMX1_9CUCU|nr:hypothetical protein NQ314_002970 [Rhamnusium bicolor]